MKVGVLGEHKAFFSILFLVAAVIIAAEGSAYYYYQQSLGTACLNPCKGSVVSVETLINYGNRTSQWINKTNIPSNWNFYDLTNNITKVQATYYGPPTSEHLVTGINGVDSHKRRCRRDPLYHLSHACLVLPSGKLARLVQLEPASFGSRESNGVLRFRFCRRLYPALFSLSSCGLVLRSHRHLALLPLERRLYLQ